MKETIICAAVKMPDDCLIRGHRHSDAMRTASGMPHHDRFIDRSLIVQGFITSRNRFVDRKEAYHLFLESGAHSVDEYLHPMAKRDELFSEDLY